MADSKESLRRSVTALERMFGVIGGFGLTMGAKTLMETWLPGWKETVSFPDSIPRGHLALFATLIVTLIPFFHGAMRHLDIVHLFSKAETRPMPLFVDYLLLFIEPIVFVMLGMSIGSVRHFLIGLGVLMAIDLLWAVVSCLWTARDRRSHVIRWIAFDVVCLALLGITFIRAVDARHITLWIAVVATVRSGLDYIFNWGFYFDTGAAGTPRRQGPRVAIESKYSDDIAGNTKFAQLACSFALKRGYNPFAMHLHFPQFLDERSNTEREMGINCGMEWTDDADEIWFCLRENETIAGSLTIDHFSASFARQAISMISRS